MSYLCVVIEDDISLQHIYNFILKREGFEVLFAKDGEEAVRILDIHTPQLIFLDVRLPLISGLDVLFYLRQNTRFNNTRIIMVSAQEHYERELNGVEFLLKPIHPTSITQIAQQTRETWRNWA